MLLTWQSACHKSPSTRQILPQAQAPGPVHPAAKKAPKGAERETAPEVVNLDATKMPNLPTLQGNASVDSFSQDNKTPTSETENYIRPKEETAQRVMLACPPQKPIGPLPPAEERPNNMVEYEEIERIAEGLQGKVKFYSSRSGIIKDNPKERLLSGGGLPIESIEAFIKKLKKKLHEGYLTSAEKEGLKTFTEAIYKRSPNNILLTNADKEKLSSIKEVEKTILMLILKKYSVVSKIGKEHLAATLKAQLAKAAKEQREQRSWSYLLKDIFASIPEHEDTFIKIRKLNAELEKSICEYQSKPLNKANKKSLENFTATREKFYKESFEVYNTMRIVVKNASKNRALRPIFTNLGQLQVELEGFKNTVGGRCKTLSKPHLELRNEHFFVFCNTLS